MDANEFRAVGHRLIDFLADYQATLEERPLFPKVEAAFLNALFDERVPQEGTDAHAVIRELDEKFFPYCSHVSHPGYMGLITPTPAPMGILGDLVASALNQNIGTYTIGPSGVAIERRVVRWLNDLVGYDERAGGNLTSGGTMASFIGLKLARDWASGDRAQHDGVTGQWAAYSSEERHVAVDKSADAVGIGRTGLRILPTDDRFRIRIDALESAIEQDRRRGIRPVCIIGIAGTTNTGAVDPLAELRRIADRERAWLHVDAAYGGGMLLSHQYPGILEGLALADSVVLDPHKWFFAPLDAGAVLVKDAARLTASFGMRPAYLTDEMDVRGERYQYCVHGFEQSRRLRGLKVWMSFKRYGVKQIGEWIDRNVDEARRLYELVAASDDFEAAVEPVMSAICIRYCGPQLDEPRLARLHREVARRIESGGRFWISTTVLKGRSYFRINPVNFRTRLEHMDELFTLLRRECAEVRHQLADRAVAR
ncbi:MAG: aminotransferase class I/II-fold pyridoxal phosphate-dependent enzyme [Gemmatimonadetes bacterium]|nr:aminotransferase class I/II-fold pyridoxal phosphate-dependent enzyme [Gemmatimonadota bacterium]